MPKIEIRVNGELRTAEVPPGATLLQVLRDVWDLTGAKYGCGEGVCGACTVLIDGRAVRSCVQPAASVKGAVATIEGLAQGEQLHPMQQAFLDEQAFQCGFCTPGMILGAVAFANQGTAASPAAVHQALDGHVCRCGAYSRITAAVAAGSQAMKGGRR